MSGADGERVLQQLRELPRSDVRQRNDLTHLGIDTTTQQVADVADDISVISATAAVTLPHTYTQVDRIRRTDADGLYE